MFKTEMPSEMMPQGSDPPFYQNGHPAPIFRSSQTGRVQIINRDIAELRSLNIENANRLETFQNKYQHLDHCTGGNICRIDHYDVGILSNDDERQMYAQICELRQFLIDSKRHGIRLAVNKIPYWKLTFHGKNICVGSQTMAGISISFLYRIGADTIRVSENYQYYHLASGSDPILLDILNIKAMIESHADRMLPRLQNLLLRARQEIAEWQRAQAFLANGQPVEYCHVDQLVECCKGIAVLLYASLEQMLRLVAVQVDKAAEEPSCRNLINQTAQQYENLIKEIVASCLIVEQQPPQVLMKDKKFACLLRHLVSDGLNIHETPFSTRVSYIATETARHLLEHGPTVAITEAGKISNQEQKSDFYKETKQLQVHMRGMTLTMKQRGDRNKAETVAEDKNCMVFRTTIKVRFPSGAECNVAVQTMSLPIVVISHGKQEPAAQGTIFWDNAFSDVVRRPFDVPLEVRWGVLLDCLHFIWKKECEDDPGNVGAGLNRDARRYLTLKLFGTEAIDPNTPVSWQQFNRIAPNKPFSFWNWFYKVKELVSNNCVKKYWNVGLIHGFVGKTECQEMLSRCSSGTFLFRFSDTVLGSVSISFLNFHNDIYEVGHLQPDTIKKFQQRSLPDMVRDIPYLHWLYPDKPKDRAFGAYYTPETSSGADPGYIPKVFNVVPKGLTCDAPVSQAASPGFISPISNRMVPTGCESYDALQSSPLFIQQDHQMDMGQQVFLENSDSREVHNDAW